MSYNIIFAGTPEFSVRTLDALIHSRHKIKAVYTQPDRPKGRGQKLEASPVKAFALQHDLPIYQPSTLRDEHEQQILQSLQADLMIVVAYGLLLPLTILQAPTFGCLNVHASLLPRWRGAAPIQRAILAGDTHTGVTIMQMNEGLDTGDMLFKTECEITNTDTSRTLHEKLATLGANALIKTLDELSQIHPERQNHALANYAHKIKKEEAKLDWTKPALQLDRQIRAFNPWPVATFENRGEVIRIFAADVLAQQTQTQQPGTIIQVSAQGIDVATGCGILRIKTLQFPGARALAVGEVLNARQEEFTVGCVLT